MVQSQNLFYFKIILILSVSGELETSWSSSSSGILLFFFSSQVSKLQQLTNLSLLLNFKFSGADCFIGKAEISPSTSLEVSASLLKCTIFFYYFFYCLIEKMSGKLYSFISMTLTSSFFLVWFVIIWHGSWFWYSWMISKIISMHCEYWRNRGDKCINILLA